MASDLPSRVQTWLAKSGYPHELRCCRAFESRDVPIAVSPHYLDPTSGKIRQIDLIALQSDDTGFFRSYLTIECKHSDKPWAILKSDSGHIGDLHSHCVYTKSAKTAFASKLDNDLREILSWKWFRGNETRGHALIECFSENTDRGYAATQSALGAALAEASRIDNEKYNHELGFFFPVVIVDSPLYTVTLSKDDSVHVTETEIGFVYAHPAPRVEISSQVIVAQIDAIDGLINAFLEHTDRLKRLMSPEVAELLSMAFDSTRPKNAERQDATNE